MVKQGPQNGGLAMIYLAGALVLIFILHLIDKHNRWKQAIKLTIGLIVLAVVGLGALWGWAAYSDYRDAQQQKQQAAIDLAANQACIARLNQTPIPTDADPAKVPQEIRDACVANSGATQYFYVPAYKTVPLSIIKSEPLPVFGWATVTPSYDTADIYKYCYFQPSGNLDGCEFIDNSVATVNKGDRVQLLSHLTRAPNGDNIYKVKFQQWTGWMDSAALTVEPPNQKKQ